MVQISLQCGCCRARIKAPVALYGQTRPCPRCGKKLVIQPQAIEDSDPILVVASVPESHETVAHRSYA